MLVSLLTPATAYASVVCEPLQWNVGTVKEGDVASLDLKVANSGAASYRLMRVFHSCDCLKVVYRPGAIASGASVTVRLELTAFDLPADFEEFLYIETDDPARPITRYSIKGRYEGGGAKKVYPPLPAGQDGKALIVHIFFSPTCGGCDDLRAEPFARILRDYGDRVAIVEHDLADISDNFFNYRLLRAFESKYGMSDEPAQAFFGDKSIAGKERIRAELYTGVESALKGRAPSGSLAPEQGGPKGLSLWWALIYGLLDGLNPCVFAGLILFVSYLAAAGRSFRQLLTVGIVYTASVFLTYLAIGLALFSFFYSAGFFPGVSSTLSYATAALAVVAGLLSLRDAWVGARGGGDNMWLKLPERLRAKILDMVRSWRGRLALYGSTFILGIIVTVIEGACTGLQYIPASRMMLVAGQTAAERGKGLLLLLAYNAAFILPLVVLLFLAAWGARFTSARSTQRKTAVIVRFVTGIALLVLGWLLLVEKLV